MSDSQDDRGKVIELVKRARSAMVTTTAPGGGLVSRPMAVQEAEFDGDLWFFASGDSGMVRQIQSHPGVNVSLANDKNSEWTSIAGTAEIVDDRAKSESLWSRPLQAWFPQGLDTPGLTLVKVTSETAEYWDAATSKVRQLLGLGRAIQRKNPDEFPATNRTVEL